MRVRKLKTLLRQALGDFAERLAEDGWEEDDDVDAEECVDDFKLMLDERVQQAVADDDDDDDVAALDFG